MTPPKRGAIAGLVEPSEIPPHDLAIERAILGAVLQEPETVAEVIEHTQPEHFYPEKNRVIRQRMGALHTAGHPVDQTLLCSALREAGELDLVGGEPYIAQLHDEGHVPQYLPRYTAVLRRLWAKRRVAQLGRQLLERSQNGSSVADDLIAVQAGITELQTGTASNRRLQILTWEEMTHAGAPPIQYDWQGWVPTAAVVLLAGAGESLKSWLALYLAVMRAAGLQPFSEDAPGPAGRVLYVTAENSIDEEKRRCAMLKAGLGLADDLPITFVAAASLSLGDEADYAAVVQLVESTKPVAIFFDSAIAVSGIAQENDNVEVRRFMKTRVLPLSRQFGATVYVIVHSPKPPTQAGARFGDEHVARGASDWRNAADAVLYLRREPTLGESSVVIRHNKPRIGKRHAPIWFRLEDVEPEKAARLVYGGTFDEATSQGEAAKLGEALRAVVVALKDTPSGLYKAGLEKHIVELKFSMATARRAVNVARGKAPWPYGPHKGQRRAIVTDDHDGRAVFLKFDAAQWRTEEPTDEE